MLVKDQIRSRMDQLGITVPALAKQLEVSAQTVRFWISGRNVPRRSQIPSIEAALSCKIDFSEFSGSTAPTATSLLEQADVELMIKMSRLPVSVKILFSQMADAFLNEPRPGLVQRETTTPLKAFSVKQRDSSAPKRSGIKTSK